MGQTLDTSEKTKWSTIITSACTLGSAVGAIFSGPVARIGKHKAILLTNILVILGAGLTLI